MKRFWERIKPIGFETGFYFIIGFISIVFGVLTVFTPFSNQEQIGALIIAIVGTILIAVASLTFREKKEVEQIRQSVDNAIAELPTTRFAHEFPEIANDYELERMIAQCLTKKYSRAGEPDLVVQSYEWLKRTLSVPIRDSYNVDVTLLKEPIRERFGNSNIELGPYRNSHLWIEGRYQYHAGKNTSEQPLLLNGNGVIQYFRFTIPETTQLATFLRANSIGDKEVRQWIEYTLQPKIEVVEGGNKKPISVNHDIDDLRFSWSGRGLRLKFNVVCNYHVMPHAKVNVVYRHYCPVHTFDSYNWIGHAVTEFLKFRMHQFNGYALIPIARNSRETDEDHLTVEYDQMTYKGRIFPNTTFAFIWSREYAEDE